MSCSILAAQSKPVEMEDGIMVIDSQSPPNSTASDKFFPDALISYYQHDDASWIGNPEKSLLLKKLRRASTVCESMDNVRGKDELKILLAESIILYREYQLGDSCDQGRYAAVYPSSPTSSMFPQLGLLEKISIIIPQLDCRHRVMELSLLTPTSNNSEKRRRKVGCLGLKRMSFKPLRRLGGNLSRMLQRIRRFGSFGLYSRGRGLTPNREPISPCLSRRHSQHESPSPAILFDGDLNEESCRSSDVVYGSSVPNHSRSDPLNFGSLRIRRNTDDMDSNQKEDMQQNKMKQVQAKSFTETKLQSQMSLMRTPSAAKTILLLETATAIGLSLCKAFLVWKHAASSYWHEQALLSPEYSQVSMASASKTIVAPLDFERKLTEGSNNFAKAATLGLTISVGPSLMAVDSGITERHGSNDSCDSYYSSGYDSCSCSDDENAGSPTCNGDEAECGDHRKDGGKYFQLDDSSAVGDVTDACRASDRVILVARNAAALKSTCKQEMTHRRQKQCKAGDSHHAESGIRRRRRHSRHNRVAPKENQETVLQSSNWLACLNDVDVTDCADAKDHDEGTVVKSDFTKRAKITSRMSIIRT